MIYSTAAERFFFEASYDGTNENFIAADSFGSPPLRTWMRILAWHDATANTANIQINNGATAGAIDGTQPFHIGAGAVPSNHLDGGVDSAFVAKRVYTADERTWFDNDGKWRSYADFTAPAAGGLLVHPGMSGGLNG